MQHRMTGHDEMHFSVDRILAEQPVASGRVAVLNCIPLARERFEADVKSARRTGLFVPRRPKDFAANCLSFIPDWSVYERLVAAPVVDHLAEMRQKTDAVLDFDVSFDDFKRAFGSGLFDAVFLLAHHFGSRVEFADGGWEMAEVQSFLKKNSPKRPVSLIFFVCKAEGFSGLRSAGGGQFGSVATAFWNVGVTDGYAFLARWVAQLAAPKKLSAAYAAAIHDFFDNQTNF